MDQLALAKVIMKVETLPALPHITIRVIKMTLDPNSAPTQISKVICQDQVLASKVLKLVNSAYYGLPRKVATIIEAIPILGMQALRNLVIGASVYKLLSGLKGKKAVNPKQIWLHGTACAVTSKLLAAKTRIFNKEHAFMAGLLHDIGKIIFSTFLHDEYLEVLEMSKKEGCPVIEAEQKLLETTHAYIGRVVAHKWNLPAILVEPIGYHHDPLFRCQNSDLVQMVHLANAISIMAGYSATGSAEIRLEEKVLERFRLSEEKLGRLAEEIKGKISIEFL